MAVALWKISLRKRRGSFRMSFAVPRTPLILRRTLPKNFRAEASTRHSHVHWLHLFRRTLLPPPSPFSAEFLTREWPLLLESCSLPRDPAKMSALASGVHDFQSLFQLADEHGVI